MECIVDNKEQAITGRTTRVGEGAETQSGSNKGGQPILRCPPRLFIRNQQVAGSIPAVGSSNNKVSRVFTPSPFSFTSHFPATFPATPASLSGHPNHPYHPDGGHRKVYTKKIPPHSSVAVLLLNRLGILTHICVHAGPVWRNEYRYNILRLHSIWVGHVWTSIPPPSGSNLDADQQSTVT